MEANTRDASGSLPFPRVWFSEQTLKELRKAAQWLTLCALCSLGAFAVELEQFGAPRTAHVQVVLGVKVLALPSPGSLSLPISSCIIKGRIEQFGKMLLMELKNADCKIGTLRS